MYCFRTFFIIGTPKLNPNKSASSGFSGDRMSFQSKLSIGWIHDRSSHWLPKRSWLSAWNENFETARQASAYDHQCYFQMASFVYFKFLFAFL